MSSVARGIFWGNLCLVVCAVFYIAWWVVAFRPVGAIKGWKSGWLLLPAVGAGVVAVVFLARALMAGAGRGALMPNTAIFVAGVVAYFILLALTWLAFKRQPTTELVLIVLWAMIMLVELNMLAGSGVGVPVAIVFLVLTILALVASLVCYVLFYRLSGLVGFIDGLIPLAVIGLVTAAFDFAIFF